MAKVVISAKIEQGVKLKLEKHAQKQKKKLSDLLIEGVFNSERVVSLENQVEALRREKQELKARLERLGKSQDLKKRISIPVTLEEFDKISQIALDQRTSKSRFLRDVLISKNKNTVSTAALVQK